MDIAGQLQPAVGLLLFTIETYGLSSALVLAPLFVCCPFIDELQKLSPFVVYGMLVDCLQLQVELLLAVLFSPVHQNSICIFCIIQIWELKS